MVVANISIIDLKNILKAALNEFYQNDAKCLLAVKGMEQACVFRIGLYMQNIMNKQPTLSTLNLDCEYNKCFNQPKTTPRHKRGARPDLIIHKRNLNPDKPNNENIMVIEFKGYWNKNIKSDIEKLEDFTSCLCGYHYKLGAFVYLNKTNFEIRYYKDGEQLYE